MSSTVSLDECVQTTHCSNNSQSVYVSTKPSLVCSSNHNSTFRHFINTADLFLIKEFHSSELWSLSVSNLKTSLLQHAKRLFPTSYSVRVTFPSKMLHCQQIMHKESGNVGPPCGSARKLYLWLRRIWAETLLSGPIMISFCISEKSCIF